ncbi:YkgB family protein [Mycobacterium sp. NPDC003323]
MTVIQQNPIASAQSTLATIGGHVARYGLVVVIGWIGALKFTSYEAHGIEPLVANSPLMSWVYDIFSVTGFSALLGVLELATAAMLAVKPWLPRVAVAGGVIAVGLFAATISFLFTTPGVGEATAGGFPVLSMTGQFLIKDVALIGISLWLVADALAAVRSRSDLADLR